MSRFISTSDTKTIRADWWDEGEEVVIRKMTIAQRDAMNERIVKITGSSADAKVTDMQIQAAQVPVLQAGVKSWTFCDEDGKRVPVSPHWINQLDPRDADYIATEIWAYNRKPEDDEGSFRAEGAGSGEGEGEQMAD